MNIPTRGAAEASATMERRAIIENCMIADVDMDSCEDFRKGCFVECGKKVVRRQMKKEAKDMKLKETKGEFLQWKSENKEEEE